MRPDQELLAEDLLWALRVEQWADTARTKFEARCLVQHALCNLRDSLQPGSVPLVVGEFS